MYSVHDRIIREIFVKNTVYTPHHMYMVLANPAHVLQQLGEHPLLGYRVFVIAQPCI